MNNLESTLRDGLARLESESEMGIPRDEVRDIELSIELIVDAPGDMLEELAGLAAFLGLKLSTLCIANNGSNGETEIPLWECPCGFCTKMDWDAMDDDRPLLRDHRHDGFPTVWDAAGKSL
jgi:hypothetical protein